MKTYYQALSDASFSLRYLLMMVFLSAAMDTAPSKKLKRRIELLVKTIEAHERLKTGANHG